LYEWLSDKSKAVSNSRVSKVDHSHEGVVVYCENGKSYAGDVVVAADGVHSVVRSEMRRYADEETKSLMEKDKKSLSAEYTCLFGIATAVPGIEEGWFYRMHNKGNSMLMIGGQGVCY
jgi:2-polyprenyl-6-methoxyphenol hydroxylase-like FAD-dependent oxidoreductase